MAVAECNRAIVKKTEIQVAKWHCLKHIVNVVKFNSVVQLNESTGVIKMLKKCFLEGAYTIKRYFRMYFIKYKFCFQTCQGLQNSFFADYSWV